MESMVAIAETDSAIQQKLRDFLRLGWHLISFQTIGANNFKYTIGWYLSKGVPIYPTCQYSYE
jgi:hypothetical protein